MINQKSSTAFIWQICIVGIISRHGFRIEMCHRDKHNKVSYHCITCYFHVNNCFKHLYIRNKIKYFSHKGGYGVFGCMCIEGFKEELAWGIWGIRNGFKLLKWLWDKWLQVIRNMVLCKIVIPLRN